MAVSLSGLPNIPFRAVDETLQVGDEVGSHLGVAVGMGRVVVDPQPLGPRALLLIALSAGGAVGFFDPLVAGDCLVAARAGPVRRPDVGVPEPLCVDAVPVAMGR